ncbi:uncharacterized protein E0L32_011041 [Thyridium curvatum]|uniref:Uncharacterized protein n=1 Tax=Thyridium curvatum TaxID=1093900 RepID=A0A507AIN2_9PEZI|nr:uncharacterized protein E0L32_011041 [Thyridium curvatum]TPX07053.1 hypothetical protein E0L32_011041 [Thyridium curvatum]
MSRQAYLLTLSGFEPTMFLAKATQTGYVGALEHRLEVTENTLLRLLSVVSDDTIEEAFSQDRLPPQRHCQPPADGAGLTGDGEPKKISYMTRWEQLPLDTAPNVRLWESSTLRLSSGSAATDVQTNQSTRVAEPVLILPQSETGGSTGPSENPLIMETEAIGSGYEDNRVSCTDPGISTDLMSGQANKEAYVAVSEPEPTSAQQLFPVNNFGLEQDPQVETLALPLDFQQQYLW